ncbi:NPCBM/NEW2 domain-containing protein [Streptomyces sp. NPDC051940]|uniref:NPCBM/NEW2 domain-containing protein n=1 Tax=Streptomyces sp. NPDC051940 TaxID=3155675 RepID=UPI003423C073
MRNPLTRTAIIGALAAALLTGGSLNALAATPPAAEPQPTPLLDDGLALTPPMGFNNWNSTHCRAEFNEAMVKGVADIFVDKGLKAAGYEYVNLDDCWALPQRDADGKLVPDPVRFPNGIKAVADYVHSKGLKFGIYTSAGTKTCNSAGFPGGLGHEFSDARQFADWGVDYLKYDNCNNQGVDAQLRYRTMRDALRATGRPIVYSICEWGQNRPWEWASDVGHLWRTTGDISDNWSSMLSLFKRNAPLAQYAGPGHWNDPDMLEVGNGGMTDTEYRSHFSLWSVMAAPLLIGSDLRKATPATFDILGNREVIAVDQDPLGKQATVLSSQGGRWVLGKPMADGSAVVALFNETSSAQTISTSAGALGLPAADAYALRDLWQHKDYNTAGSVSASVPAHGTVLFRVSVQDKWALFPPAAELGADTAPYLEPGTSAEFTTTFRDLGRTSALMASVDVRGAQGWTAEPLTATSAAAVPTGQTLTTRWRLTAPPGTAPGSYPLTVSARYSSPTGQQVALDVAATAFVVVGPPSGDSYVSDLTWVSATNGWGPVEKDTSNGERPAGDGHPLTVNGQVWTKGLGVHAPSEIVYFTGSRCARFTAWVGVDDEEGADGSVSFEVWADDHKVADSGVLTNAMPATQLTADVSSATLVRLITTDGGDDVNSDHADWSDAKLLTCT